MLKIWSLKPYLKQPFSEANFRWGKFWGRLALKRSKGETPRTNWLRPIQATWLAPPGNNPNILCHKKGDVADSVPSRDPELHESSLLRLEARSDGCKH